MARKSKYGQPSAKLSTTLWAPALYIRLSREDGDREESNSIASQRELLTEFVDTQTDMTSPRLYTDDGYTGTDFDRPDFQRMLNDLRAGIINCVIVKDLSRFGRNYVGVGEYLEHVFPLLNVRFISVSDNVDSYLDPRSVNNLVVPFKNILNDEYARDISNKVRASLDLKRRQGKFIGSFASYGYRKDPNDHSRLLIDEVAAAIVRDIFNWFIGGTSVLGIAKRLNEQGIPNPSAYKRCTENSQIVSYIPTNSASVCRHILHISYIIIYCTARRPAAAGGACSPGRCRLSVQKPQSPGVQIEHRGFPFIPYLICAAIFLMSSSPYWYRSRYSMVCSSRPATSCTVSMASCTSGVPSGTNVRHCGAVMAGIWRTAS